MEYEKIGDPLENDFGTISQNIGLKEFGISCQIRADLDEIYKWLLSKINEGVEQ